MHKGDKNEVIIKTGAQQLWQNNLLNKYWLKYLLGGWGSSSSWLGVCPKLLIWFSTASFITGSWILSASTQPSSTVHIYLYTASFITGSWILSASTQPSSTVHNYICIYTASFITGSWILSASTQPSSTVHFEENSDQNPISSFQVIQLCFESFMFSTKAYFLTYNYWHVFFQRQLKECSCEYFL